MGAAIDTMMPGVIDGLAACGVDSPFARMYRKQDACAMRVQDVAMPAAGELPYMPLLQIFPLSHVFSSFPSMMSKLQNVAFCFMGT